MEAILNLQTDISEKAWGQICATLKCDPKDDNLRYELGRIKGGYASDLLSGGDARPSEVNRILRKCSNTIKRAEDSLEKVASVRTASHIRAAALITAKLGPTIVQKTITELIKVR